jgi:uncharacterized protein (TIGR02270 family)
MLWDIYEEHLEEAAFLWGQWERALVAANQAIGDVIDGPEERLLAHLDGLVLGGPRVAERLLLPALADDDVGKVFAGTWALVQSEDDRRAESLRAVLDALPAGKPPARAALGRALELSWRADLAKPLALVWEKSDPQVRGALFDALAVRDAKWVGDHVAAALVDKTPTLRCAALRAVRRMPPANRAAYGDVVEDALGAEEPAVRHEAIATGYAMGVRRTRDACRREAQVAGDGCRLPLALLAARGDRSDRELLMARLAVPEARRHVLWALGFAGDIAAADALVAAMDDEKFARVAGESFSAITGASIAGRLVKPGVTKGPGVEDVEPDDPLPEALPEDLLLVPAADAVRTWWDKARRQMQGGARYLYGEAQSSGASNAAIRRASMWRWPVLALEAAVRGEVVETRGWARKRRL